MKKIISIILSIIIMISCFSGCSKKEKVNVTQTPTPQPTVNDTDKISKAEWIKLLSETFGMEDFTSQEDYFKDVNMSSDIYTAVQSSYEWEVLDFEGENFNPNDKASKEFVAYTALVAADVLQSETIDEYKDYASENGLVFIKSDWNEGLTIEEAEYVLDVAQEMSLASPTQEVEEIKLAENVKDLRDLTDAQISVIDTTVTVDTASAGELTVGDIIITPPSGLDLEGVAMKVESITENGSTLTIQTVEPEVEELFEEVKIIKSVVPDLNNIVLEEGVSADDVSPLSSNKDVTFGNLVYNPSEQANVVNTAKGLNRTFTINFTKGTMGLVGKWEDFQLSAESLVPSVLKGESIGATPDEQLGELFEKTNYVYGGDNSDFTKPGETIQELSVENKFKGGYEITGSFAIKNLYLDVDVDMRASIKNPIKRTQLTINADFETNLNIKGTLEDELKIATIPVAIGGGVTVDIEIYAFVEANGEIGIKTTLSNNIKITYEKSKFKKVTKKDASATAEVAVKVYFGPEAKAIIKMFGKKIIDFEVKVGVVIDPSSSITSNVTETSATNDNKEKSTLTRYKLDVSLSAFMHAPVIEASVGYSKDTLANKLKIKGKWDVVPKEKANLKIEIFNKTINIYDIEVENLAQGANIGDLTDDTEVVWTEPIIEDAVREILNKPTGVITCSELDEIKYLYVYANVVLQGMSEDLDWNEEGTKFYVNGIESAPGTIKSLNDFAYFRNLQRLYIKWNSLTDISGISNLNSLVALSLCDTQISDISPLENLTNLKELDISNNLVADITPLSNLTNINMLFLNNNQITDISSLENLINLNMLVINSNQISDISALKNLNNLSYFESRKNPITDWSPVDHVSMVANKNMLTGEIDY